MKNLVTFLFSLIFSTPIFSGSFVENLKALLETHPRVQASQNSFEATVERIQETHAKQFGFQLDFTMSEGYQRYKKPLLDMVEKEGEDNSFKITRMLYDFGKSEALLEDARFTSKQTEITVGSVRQALLLEAVTAYLSYLRAKQILEFARKSEANIQKQTKLENILVKKGKGYSSNVLQAKTHLAGAQSRRVRAEGGVLVAEARVRAVFRELKEKLNYDDQLKAPMDSIPDSLEDAIEIAMEKNRQILIGTMRSAALNERIKSTYAKEFRPRFQFLGEVSRDFDKEGNDGLQENTKAFVQVVFPLNASGAGSHALHAAQNEHSASVKREKEAMSQVREQVTISWQNLITANTNEKYLSNQVNIAQQFLSLARKERQNGRRSLLDVLSAETSLINAQSDHVSTSFDIKIAAFTLLQAMGVLDLQKVESSVL